MFTLKRTCLLVIMLLLLPLAASAQSFTLEQVLSAPYPSELTSAEKADRIAWVMNDEGVRNIWTATAPDYEPIQLTEYTEDDGLPLSSLILSPDGSFLIYIRGGARNRAGEHPNPTSDPKGGKQSIWMINTNGEGEPLRISGGANPVLSPDGKSLLFHRGALHTVTLPDTPSDSLGKAKQLFDIRGNNNSAVWSPDGSKIAFVSDRGGHSFIGVYHMDEERIQWIAPGVDRDMNPVWSPDGKRLAFIRVPGAKKDELFNLTGGWEFSIRIADIETGRAETIWSSPSDDGGFAQYYPQHPLRWAAEDRILFYSEHEDWMHIYSIKDDGSGLTDLTPGESEAEQSELSKNGQTLYFSSNLNDIDRRHIWSNSISGDDLRQITSGEDIETYPFPVASGSRLFFLQAGAQTPQGVASVSLSADNPDITRITPDPGNSFPTDQLVVPEQVIFEAADGVTVHGQLFRPTNIRGDNEHPAVIFMHGGPIRQMLLGWHYSGYYANAYAFNQYLAGKGYVVLSVNFRAGIGYGRDFRRAPGQGPRGASEYRDILAGAKFLQQLPEVDPLRLGLWGGSYGGLLTAMGLARDSDLFKAGVDLHGVHDWAYRATDFTDGGGWGITEDELDLAFQSSPEAYIDGWTSPVLFVHGDDDRNVLFSQTTDLVQRLRERSVPLEILVFPDEVHGFLRHENWLRTFKTSADFFDRYLQEE